MKVDPGQVEAHYSLGVILRDIGEPERAAFHFRSLFLGAAHYTHMKEAPLRLLLATGLQTAFHIHLESRRAIPFLPSSDEFAAVAGGMEQLAAAAESVHQDQLETFYPFAEMLMGRPAEGASRDGRAQSAAGGGSILQQGEGRTSSGWGSDQRPIVVKVRTEEKGRKVALVCERFGWKFIMGFDPVEDLTDLKRALKETMSPANMYELCLCGSGEKYKFCCAKRMKSFNLDVYIEQIASESVG